MKTPTVWTSKDTSRGYEELRVTKVVLQQQQQFRASVCSLARCLDKRDQGHEAFVADYTQAFLNAEVRQGEQLYVQPPGTVEHKDSDGWQTCGVESVQSHAGSSNISEDAGRNTCRAS